MSDVKSISKEFQTIPVFEQETRGCGANEAEAIHMDITVPTIRPTDTGDGNIINVSYVIRVSVPISLFLSLLNESTVFNH